MAILWPHACRGMGLGASRQREGLSWLAMVATWLCHGEAGFSGKTELGALSRMVDMFWALLGEGNMSKVTG